MPSPLIDTFENRQWQNWLGTHGVGGPVKRLRVPHNLWGDGTALTPGKDFEPGLAGLRQLVQEAEAAGRRIRAVGSGWSLSNAGFTDDDLIDTSRLGWGFVGFHTLSMVDPARQADASRLVFAQCGTQIRTLNTWLAQRALALPTSGASNGQTIAGAISTGTHGSAHAVGAIHDCVVGLHLVSEGGKHVWLERPSRPAMSAQFAQWLGAQRVRDEDLFLAAVVGFGSFGLIHAVMLEAEPLYLLERTVKRFDHAQVLAAAQSLDVSGLGLPDGATLPFHFELVFNPYFRKTGDGGAMVRALYRRPVNGPLPAPPATQGDALMGQDLVAAAATLSDAVPALIPALMQSQLLKTVAPTAAPVLGTPGQQYGDNPPESGVTSVELGVPLSRVSETVQAIFAVFDAHPFGAAVALRYVKAGDALLGLNCHAPITCTIELPGIDSDRAHQAHPYLFGALYDAGIPAAYHWGQAAPFDEKSVRLGYGDARVDRWLAARRAFLTPAGRKTFSNVVLDSCLLAD